MQGGKAPPDARSPDYSDGYRHTDMQGMAMSDHAKIGMLLMDQLEVAHDNHGNNAGFLDAQAWYGEDFNKLWLKVEGESADGKLEDLRTEVLWDHAISSYWGTQLGVRQDFGEGPERTWAAFGVQGLAPYWFDTEATLYVGQQGRTAARVQFEYEELLTQRLGPGSGGLAERAAALSRGSRAAFLANLLAALPAPCPPALRSQLEALLAPQ